MAGSSGGGGCSGGAGSSAGSSCGYGCSSGGSTGYCGSSGSALGSSGGYGRGGGGSGGYGRGGISGSGAGCYSAGLSSGNQGKHFFASNSSPYSPMRSIDRVAAMDSYGRNRDWNQSKSKMPSRDNYRAMDAINSKNDGLEGINKYQDKPDSHCPKCGRLSLTGAECTSCQAMG